MSVYKQKNSKNWWINLYQGKGKKPIRISSGTPDKIKAAAIEANMKMAMVGNVRREALINHIDALMGWDESKTGLPLSQIGETYKSLPDNKASEGTITTRVAHVRRMVEFMKSHWPTIEFMHQISRPAAVAYTDHLRKECATGKTYNNTRANLVTVFKTLMIRAGCQENVWSLTATASTKDSKHGRAFDESEEKRVMEQCKAAGHQWHPISIIARYTGLRYGDIANLKATQIQDGCIVLFPSKTAKHKIKVRIPMHPVVERAISDLKVEVGNLFPDHCFADYKHRPLKGDYAPILRKAKIRTKGAVLSFHCWRHTFRTRLAAADVPAEIAMKLGGWTDADTAELYNHDTSQLKKAICAMA